MAYCKEFKLKAVKHAKLGLSSIPVVAGLKKIPKQTLYNWIESYERLGEEGLENDKPGAKETEISPQFEQLILLKWKDTMFQKGRYKRYFESMD